MGHSYSFAVIRFAPDDVRGERLNIGLIVFTDHGVDIRLSRRLDRVKVMSGALNIDSVALIAHNLEHLDAFSRQEGKLTVAERADAFKRVGPLALSEVGTFVTAATGGYEERIQQIMRVFVEPEPAIVKSATKKTRLFSEIKMAFKKKNVLASKHEGIESHRIVFNHAIYDGLFADLCLKNSVYHIIQTVDASGDENMLRRSISSIAVSALVLESARMKFGQETKGRLVYQASASLEKFARPSLDAAQHQGSELINWASVDDRLKFINTISALAEPLEPEKKRQFIVPKQDSFFH